MDMEMHLDAPPIFFMHVPKTAGESCAQVLRWVYPRRRILAFYSLIDLRAVSLAELKRFDCYMGHGGPGFYDLIGRPDVPCFTVLRDPIERAISNLYFVQRETKRKTQRFNRQYGQWTAAHLQADLASLLADPAIANLSRDGQTRTMGVVRDFRPFLKDGAQANTDPALLRAGSAAALNDPHDMAQVFSEAQRRLEGMAVVGLTERLNQSMELVADLIGVSAPPEAPRINVGPMKTQVDTGGYRATTAPELLEQIEALTTYDRELYARAQDLFREQYVRYSARPRRSYSIAARVRLRSHRLAFTSWQWMRKEHPALAENRVLQAAKVYFKGGQ